MISQALLSLQSHLLLLIYITQVGVFILYAVIRECDSTLSFQKRTYYCNFQPVNIVNITSSCYLRGQRHSLSNLYLCYNYFLVPKCLYTVAKDILNHPASVFGLTLNPLYKNLIDFDFTFPIFIRMVYLLNLLVLLLYLQAIASQI